MVQSKTGRVLTDLERDLGEELRQRLAIQESPHAAFPGSKTRAMAPAPDYVEHNDRATEVGRLSAEAVVGEYEAAAKEIEAMGVELIDRVKQCEAMTRDALAVVEEMKSTATRYREEAKRLFVQIESSSQVTADVRKACVELKERIANRAV